ncbi:MAG: hypothetical protein QOG53_895 [Frankiales bacterium]|nr:hypothetical protein [Frankiales bacterium]
MTEIRSTAKTTVSVVIVNWNGAEILRPCLDSLRKQSRLPDQVVVVDNGSTDDSVRLIATAYPDVELVRLATNTGFAGGANAGIRASTGELVALLNNDVETESDWLEALVCRMDELPSEVGFLAPKILDAAGTSIDSVGDFLDAGGIAQQRGYGTPDDGRWDSRTSITSACAAASLYRRAMFDDVGLLDERFFAYLEDVDLCLRGVLRGWRGEYVPNARVRHAASLTSSKVSGFKRYHSIRNAYYLLVKTMPRRLLLYVLPRFILSQFGRTVGALFDGELGAALRAHRDAVRTLAPMRAERRRIMAGATCTPKEFRTHLQPTRLVQRTRTFVLRRWRAS